MKKKYASLMMVFLLANASLDGTACLCVSADCSGSSGAREAKTPQCHHAAAPTPSQGQAPRNCCGKCQLEKRAVLAPEGTPLAGISSKQGFIEIGAFSDLKKGMPFPVLSKKGGTDFSPLFFTELILNTTFAFRGPPVG